MSTAAQLVKLFNDGIIDAGALTAGLKSLDVPAPKKPRQRPPAPTRKAPTRQPPRPQPPTIQALVKASQELLPTQTLARRAAPTPAQLREAQGKVLGMAPAYRRVMGKEPPAELAAAYKAAPKARQQAALATVAQLTRGAEELVRLKQAHRQAAQGLKEAFRAFQAPKTPLEYKRAYPRLRKLHEAAQARVDLIEAATAELRTTLAPIKQNLSRTVASALAPPPDARRRYYAHLQYHKPDEKKPGRYYPAGDLRCWGSLDNATAARVQANIGLTVHRSVETEDVITADGDLGLTLAKEFDFQHFNDNRQSNPGRYKVIEFRRDDGAHERGAWDAAGERVMDGASRFQPHLVHELLEGGAPICREAFFREGACLINAFLETFADSINARLKRPHQDLTHAGLYRLATGEEAPAEGPLPVSLRQAEAWLAKWRIPTWAVNGQGELIYTYLPDKANSNLKKGPSVFYLVVHDAHAFSVIREPSVVKTFCHLVAGQEPPTPEQLQERDRKALSGSLGQDLPCAKLWHHPAKPEPLSADTTAVVDNAAEVLGIFEDPARKDVALALTGAEPDELIWKLWEAGHKPEVCQMRHGVAESFVVQHGRRTLYVKRVVDGETRGDQPAMREAFTLESQSSFNERLHRLRETLMPRNGLSRYSETLGAALRGYSRGPRVGLLGPAGPKQLVTGIDVRRCYTAELASLSSIPVFSEFDALRPYDGSAIAHTSYYTIQVPPEGRDGILFADEHDGVWGETVEFARAEGLPFEIVGVCQPHRVVAVNARAELQALYSSGQEDESLKMLPNIAYGLANKTRNTKQRGLLFKNELEAYTHSGKVCSYGPGFLALRSGEQDLEEGYLPVARMVLDGARRKLYQAVKALKPLGALGVRCDAVYVPQDRAREVPAALVAAGLAMVDPRRPLWDNVGCFRFEKGDKELPSELLSARRSEVHPVRPQPAPAFQELALLDECDADEVASLYPTLQHASVDAELDAMCADHPDRGALLIVAKYPGAGKSFISKDHARRNDEIASTLFVCPTNDLRDNYLLEGFQAITLHTLVGKGGRDGVDGGMKAYPIGDVRRVVFEEVFLHPTYARGWIVKYMKRHPELAYVANGDPRQNKPVGEELVYDDRAACAYAFENLASVFPRKLTLMVNKRIKDPVKRKTMERLCDDLDAEELATHEILQDLPRCSFNDIDWTQGQIVAYQNTKSRVNAAAHTALHPEQGLTEWFVGDIVRGASGGLRCRGGRINSSAIYTVVAVNESHVTVRGRDGKDRSPTLVAAEKALTRPHARTNHAAQGSSIEGTIYIHDWRSPMATHTWLRTAVSRSTTCDVVLVDGAARQRFPEVFQIDARIALHRQTDTAKGFAWDEDAYVTSAWVRARFEQQRFACACGEAVDGSTDWSIDRVVNALPHLQGNCQLACRHCQNASCHRP